MNKHKNYGQLNRTLRQFKHVYVLGFFLLAFLVFFIRLPKLYNVEVVSFRCFILLQEFNRFGLFAFGPAIAAMILLNQDLETGFIRYKISASGMKSQFILSKLRQIYYWTAIYTFAGNVGVILMTKSLLGWFVSTKQISYFILSLACYMITELWFVSFIFLINLFVNSTFYGLISILMCYGIGHVILYLTEQFKFTRINTWLVFPFLYGATGNFTGPRLLIQLVSSLLFTVILFFIITVYFNNRDWNLKNT